MSSTSSESLTARGTFLTVRETASEVRVTDQTIRAWINGGKLEARKTLTGRWLIPRSEVDRVLGADLGITGGGHAAEAVNGS